jgi:lysophospholipase L1-like esterase
MTDSINAFQYSIDNGAMKVLDPPVGSQVSLASGLTDGTHSLQFWRRTEGSYGPTVINGLVLDPGKQVLSPSARPPHKIEVLGDSISAGYGDEDPANSGLGSSATSENAYDAYGPQLARMLNAEWSIVARSGFGMYRNLCASAGDVMPLEFKLVESPVVAGGPSWDFSQWQADVLIVTLGTNDWANYECMSTPLPTDSEFETAYEQFLTYARMVYPKAEIFAVGVFLSSAFGTQWPECNADISAAVTHMGDSHMHAVDSSTWLDPTTDFIGDDTHPTVAGHTKIATKLAGVIKPVLGW